MRAPKHFKDYNQEIAKLLQNDSIGILPTDTVYGLVCSAESQKATMRLYRLKSRVNKPGTVLASNIDQLTRLGIDENYLKIAAQFWPNAISIIIPCTSLDYLHQGKGSLAVRIPKNAPLVNFLELTGPLLTTSANAPGEPEATTIQQAQEYFGDNVDFYVDDGDLSGRKPSTIIKLANGVVEVVREGAVKINEQGKLTI